MRILKVIHGYPMRYNAGSEVYSQTLCQALADHHEVHVFTREEDSFAPDYALRTESDPDDPRITLHLVNNPRHRDRYRVEGIDQRFSEVIDRVAPDVVHIGHLNHLSTSIVQVAARRGIPVIMTLHDYWLMCPRGQFMQTFPEDPQDLWAACDAQNDAKCAERCYSRYYGGSPEEIQLDRDYWTTWVGRRMKHVREMVELVDLFIAPAHYLRERFVRDFGLPPTKVVYRDYGFDRTRMAHRARRAGEPFTFGYIGTHIPAKGIHDLLCAFGALGGDYRLRIWGRPRGQDTDALRAMAQSLPNGAGDRVEWTPEYRNQQIVADVFNLCDAIVVPSIWVENSPLVIHEAQQARVPVITADVGGMAEYVRDGVNGLLFKHRSVEDLTQKMRALAADPTAASALGARGYLDDPEGNVPDISQHAREIEELYCGALARRDSARVLPSKGPWRITFDTNPDHCNLKCIMCEEHSEHSSLQRDREAAGKPRRVMDIEMIRRVMAEGAQAGLREIIPSTMGEPLLYHEFEEIIALCKQHGVMMNLTTNGTFPRLGATKWAEKLVPITSDVKISWNGATAATHERIMVGTNWTKVVRNLEQFIAVRDAHAATGQNRCRVTLQLTFLKSNVAELADIVRFAVSKGVDRVKGHHLWAHFDAIKDESMRRSPQSILEWNEAVAAADAVARDNPLPNGERVLLENIFALDPLSPHDLAPGGQCPFLGQEAWVSAEGRFNPCCAPDAERRSLGEFGDLASSGLLEIWNGNTYRELTETYRNRALCRGCNMRKPVGGKS